MNRDNSLKSQGLNKPLPTKTSIKVIGEVPEREVLTFDSVADISKYIKDNQETLEGYTSQRLNTSLKLPGYRVGKRKDKVVLIREDRALISGSSISSQISALSLNISDMSEKIDSLETKCVENMQIIADSFNQFADKIDTFIDRFEALTNLLSQLTTTRYQESTKPEEDEQYPRVRTYRSSDQSQRDYQPKKPSNLVVY